MPMAGSAPNKLIKALSNIVNAPPAPTVLPAVQTYFENIASTQAEPLQGYYKNIKQSVLDPQAYGQLLKDKLKSSMLRNTVSLTVLKCGYKTNVIPAEAAAELDCRLLPGCDKDKFIAELQEKIGDSSIKVSVLDWVKAEPSPYESELFSVIQDVAKREAPGVPVVPMVVPWFTDSHWFRQCGAVGYGFAPFKLDSVHLATMHGKNERIPIQSFKDGMRMLQEIVEKTVYAP